IRNYSVRWDLSLTAWRAAGQTGETVDQATMPRMPLDFRFEFVLLPLAFRFRPLVPRRGATPDASGSWAMLATVGAWTCAAQVVFPLGACACKWRSCTRRSQRNRRCKQTWR